MSNRMRAAIVVLVLLAAGWCAGSWAQQAAKKKAPDRAMPDLVAALKASPGCLGVETAKTSSRKDVIFAWFENKQAVLNWYKGSVHQQLMKNFFPDQTFRKPLKAVPDEGGPIMVIASITMAKEPKFKETPLPISQIAIELYQPVPGGAALGGRFAPKTVKVANFRDYTAEGNE